MYTLDTALAAVLDAGAPTLLVRLVSLDSDGSELASYDLRTQVIVGGSARAELRRDVRRSAALEVAATPSLPESVLEQGSRMRVESGGLVASGPVFVPLVTGFVTGATSRMRSGGVSLTVESYLSACRQEAGEALLIAAGTPIATALLQLWGPVLPTAEWLAESVARERTVGTDVPVLPTDSRLDVGLRLARAAGCEAFDDRLGRIVVRARQEPSSQETVRAMTAVELTRGYSRPPVNAQPVEASPGDGEPFYVLEEITDQASPFHRDRIGLRMAPTIRSDSIPDPATARELARSWLAGRMLRADTVSDQASVRNIDLDEGDVVSWDETVTRTTGRFQLESIDYPLGPGSIAVTAAAVLPLFLSEEAT